MNRISLLLAACVFVATVQVNAQAQEAKPLWGEWRLENASVPIPVECRRMAYSFKPDGTSQGNDGKAIIEARYSVAAASGGLLVHWTYLSDNGQPGCQGQTLDARRKAAMPPSLVVFEGGDRLRMHLGESTDAPYLVLTRSK